MFESVKAAVATVVTSVKASAPALIAGTTATVLVGGCIYYYTYKDGIYEKRADNVRYALEEYIDTLSIDSIVDNGRNGYAYTMELEDRVDEIVKALKKAGSNITEYTGKDNENNVLSNIIKAEIMSQYPDLRASSEVKARKKVGASEVQGGIVITKGESGVDTSSDRLNEDLTDYDLSNAKFLKYIPYDQFKSYIDNNSKEVEKYYSLKVSTEDSDNDEEKKKITSVDLVVAGWTTENTTVRTIEYEPQENGKGNQIDDKKTDKTEDKGTIYRCFEVSINYKDMLSKYSMPAGFLWSMMTMGEDPDFVVKLAKLAIEKTLIVFEAQDSVTVTINENVEKYYLQKEIDKEGRTTRVNGSYIEGNVKNNIIANNESSITTTITTRESNTKLNLVYARTWLATYKNQFKNTVNTNVAPNESWKDDPANFSQVDDNLFDRVTEENVSNKPDTDPDYDDLRDIIKMNINPLNHCFEKLKEVYNGIRTGALTGDTELKNLFNYDYTNKSDEDRIYYYNNYFLAKYIKYKTLGNDYNKENIPVIEEYERSKYSDTLSENASNKTIIDEIETLYNNNGDTQAIRNKYNELEDVALNGVVKNYVVQIKQKYIEYDNVKSDTSLNAREKHTEFTNILNYIKNEIFPKLKNYVYSIEDNIDAQIEEKIDILHNTLYEKMDEVAKELITLTYAKTTSIKSRVQNRTGNNIQHFNQNTFTSAGTVVQEMTDIDKNNNFVAYLKKSKKSYAYITTSPEWVYEMLESHEKTANMVDLFRYLLYKATNISYGVTSFEFELVDRNNSIAISSDASWNMFMDWLKSMEGHEGISADGKNYIVGDVLGNRTVGYGVDLDANPGNDSVLKSMGYNTSIGAQIPIDVVDNLMEQEVMGFKNYVDSATSGLNLTIYQKYALYSRAYNCGGYGAIERSDFVNSYKKYWSDELTKENYKQQAKYDYELYTKCMAEPTNNGLAGLINRRKYEWQLFSTGYFHNTGTYASSITSSNDINQRILDSVNWLIPVLRQKEFQYGTLTDIGREPQHPMLDGKGNLTSNAVMIGSNYRISCAAFVTETLYHAGLIDSGDIIWATYGTKSAIISTMKSRYSNRGVTITEVSTKDAKPGDILMYNTTGLADCHTCILTEINNETFRKTGSPEFNLPNNPLPISELSNWIIFRVVGTSK